MYPPCINSNDHGKATHRESAVSLAPADVSLMRVASAALDEAAEWLQRRVGTYDEQVGEADVVRRADDASGALKLRLAAYVLDGRAGESDDCLERG